MANTLQPINPLEYITERDPIPESIKDVSKWFKTETVELNFGSEVGRPSEQITANREMLAWYFSQGWYIDAVLGTATGGQWKSVATASSSQNSLASNNSNTSSSSNAKTNGTSQNKPYGTYSSATEFVAYGANVSSNGSASNSGSSNTNGTAQNSGTATSRTEQEGGPYWWAYQRIRLKRRKMQSESVLQDMITSFTKAYNEGRDVNNSRYDELVALYSIMLQRTENEANKWSLSVDDFKPLADAVITSVSEALKNFKGSVANIPDDWMKSRIDDINRKFDAIIGQAKSKMVTEGTYNSTVWPTTLSGIEHERAHALNALKDDMVTVKIDAYGKIATISADIGNKLLDCEIRIIEAQQKMLLGPTEVRNTVFKWMLDFMERRDDDYPGLDQLVTIADRLGYGDGASQGAEA